MRPKKSNNIKQKDTKIDGAAVFVSFSQGNKKVPEQTLFPLLFCAVLIKLQVFRQIYLTNRLASIKR